MSKSILIIISVVMFLLLISSAIYIFILLNGTAKVASINNKEELIVEYGDRFPYEYLTAYNKGASGKDTVIFYLSDTCSICVEKLPFIGRMNTIFKDKLNILVVWDGNIPTAHLKRNGVSEEINYRIQDEYKLNTGNTPQFFLTDNLGSISFSTQASDMDKFINRIINDYSDEKIKENVLNFMLNDNASENYAVVFTTENCEACLNLKNEIDRGDKYKGYEIIYVYDESIDDDGRFKDEGGLFKKIYEINEYPFILTNTKD